MIRKFWAVLRWTVGGFTALVASAVLATAPAVAQSTQSSVTASDLFNGSTQQSFQNATSQIQNGSTSNDTSTGSGSVLRQAPSNGSLAVSSGPGGQQSPQTTQHTNWTAFWLWIVVIASLVGLFALYLYSRQLNKRQAVAATEVAEEIIEQVENEQKLKKNKKPKSKKKTKKHHR